MRSVLGVFLAMAVALLLVTPALAQQPADHQATPPLVQLLQSKGILTADEAATISRASSADEANAKLAQLLVAKGLISEQDYNNTVAAAAPGGAQLVNAVATQPAKKSFFSFVKNDPDAVPDGPAVIPAIAPVQTLPIDLPKDPKGLIPDIKLGSGAMLQPYGFIKATAIYDSSNSGGTTFGNNDFPLPMLLGDTGPDGGSQFHTKMRSSRLGTNFYWPSAKWDLIVTGKVEFDFEGDFTEVNNRNVSSLRSSQASIRHAWVRLDTHLGGLPVFAEFGQDWTLLASSTMPDILETTQLMAFFGNIYERLPQIKGGVQFHAGNLIIEPEAAVVMGAFGDANLANTTPFCTIALSAACPANLPFVPASSVAEQLNTRFGARIGSDSGEPGIEGRIVFRYPLFQDKSVAPAQIVFSAHHATGSEIITHGQLATANSQTNVVLPALTFCGNVAGCTVAQAFPQGFRFDIPQNIWTAEFQLPTPWITLVGKYYRGGDTRFFFGDLNSTFADTMGLGVIANTIAVSGDNIPFVNVNGAPVFAKLRPTRSQGGFVQASFPLSRIFHADPEGHNAGWTVAFTGGLQSTSAEDVRRTGANDLLGSGYFATTLRYKVNRWASIINETTWYETKCALNDVGGCTAAKLFRGVESTNAHDWRNEFGTVITF